MTVTGQERPFASSSFIAISRHNWHRCARWRIRSMPQHYRHTGIRTRGAMNEVMDGRRGIKYLGQYKPIAPYHLPNGFEIVPAGSGMFPYGHGGEENLNVSYFVGPEGISDTDLSEAFRHWLAFDAFLLNDHFPIYYFDESKIGAVEVLPPDIANSANGDGYKQVDYENIVKQVFWPPHDSESLPSVAYSVLFKRYKTLSSDLLEMIEWSVSYPFRSQTPFKAFFNTNFWELIHAVILLEKLIWLPPLCEKSPGKCDCGETLQPHHSIPRKEWLRAWLARRVESTEIVEEYAQVIKSSHQHKKQDGTYASI